jgi:hypothetical protein
MRARFATGAGLLGLIAALGLAPAASADTATIGAAASPGSIFGGAANFAVIQRATDAASPSFAVPQVPAGGGPWSVTSWGALGGAGNGSASLEIWRPTGTPGELRLIAIGPQQDFPMGVLTAHSVSIPVQPGDHLGVLSGSGTGFSPSYGNNPSGDEAIWPNSPTTPAVGQTIGAPSSDFYPNGGASDARANVQATVTSTPSGAATTPTTTTTTTKKKCKKKKKHKRSADTAKKKKCKKHKRH